MSMRVLLRILQKSTSPCVMKARSNMNNELKLMGTYMHVMLREFPPLLLGNKAKREKNKSEDDEEEHRKKHQ